MSFILFKFNMPEIVHVHEYSEVSRTNSLSNLLSHTLPEPVIMLELFK